MMTMSTRRWIVYSSWIMLVLSLITILGLGQWVQRLHREQQRVRGLAATILRGHLNDVDLHLHNAQRAADQGDIDQLIAHLHRTEQTFYVASRSADLYRVVLTRDQHDRDFDLGLSTYAFRLSDLAFAIEQRQTILPADRERLSAFQADSTLMLSSFSGDLLAQGSYEDVAAAMTTFCQQLQATDIKDKYGIHGMDAASRAACSPPSP